MVRPCEYESNSTLPNSATFCPGASTSARYAAVEPLSQQHARFAGRCRVRERGFEQAQVAPLESGYLGRTHLRQHCGHLSGSKLADRFDVAAVFVAEGRVGQKIVDALEAFGLQHRRARRANAFHVHEWSREVQRFS